MRRRRWWRGLAGLALACTVLCGLGIVGQLAWETEGAARYRFPGQRLDVGLGQAVRVRCLGASAPSSPVIVFESSGVGSLELYDQVDRELPARLRRCAYDRLGFGLSDAPRSAPSFARNVEVLERVIAHARGESARPVVLVASSFGGLVAYAAARRAPHTVRGLVMLDAVGLGAFPAMDRAWARLDSVVKLTGLAAAVGLLRLRDPLGLGDSPTAWLVYRQRTWRAVADLLHTRHEAAQALAPLQPLPATTHLVVIRHQRIGDLVGPAASPADHRAFEPAWQSAQQALADEVPGTQVQVAEGAGHLIAHDAPSLVADQVLRACSW